VRTGTANAVPRLMSFAQITCFVRLYKFSIKFVTQRSLSTPVWSITVIVGKRVNQSLISTQPGHPLWLGAVITSESLGVNRHTAPCNDVQYIAEYSLSRSVCWCPAEGKETEMSDLDFTFYVT